MGHVRYSVVVEWDPIEELYTATVPALSIGSYGNSRGEAMSMVKEAIQVTVEGLQASGQPVPDGDGESVVVLDVAV